MKPKNIFLIRHGLSQGNVDKSIYCKVPDYAVRLTEKGIEQAKEAGNILLTKIQGQSDLHYIQFYCSSYHRARETFFYIKESIESEAITFYREDPRLREQEWLGGLKKEDISMGDIQKERDDFGSFYYRFHGGESCCDVFDRVTGFLDTLQRDFEKEDFPENAVIISHGMTLRVLLMRWFKYSVEEFELLRNPKNCCIIHLTLDEITNKYKLVDKLEEYHSPRHPYQLEL